MSIVNQFNSTSLSFFDMIVNDVSNLKFNCIRDYIISCKKNNEPSLIEKFIINILPYYENIKNKNEEFLQSDELGNIFNNNINLNQYLNNDEKISMTFLYLDLLCNMSIEYLKINKLLKTY